MKIVYLGVYRDSTGYAQAAISNILSCEAARLDIVCRPITLNHNKSNEPCPVQHLEKKSLDNVDVVIQHILPHCFQYKHGVKNIGFFEIETDKIRKTDWLQAIGIMDEIWVPCFQNKKALEFSGVKVPIKIVPHAIGPIDSNNQEKLPGLELDRKCVFYIIGEFTKRKNYASLLRSYLSSFSYKDNVALMIKTNVPGQNPDQSLQTVQKFINDIKTAICLYPKSEYYPPIYVITQRLNNEQMHQLYNTGTYFVSGSHGEAWGLPLHEALNHGKPAIVSGWGGHQNLMGNNQNSWNDQTRLFESLETNCGWLINGQLTPCFGMTEFSGNIYCGKCCWFDTSIEEFSQQMIEAYNIWQNNKAVYDKMSINARNRAQQFSYEKVGKIIRDILEN